MDLGLSQRTALITGAGRGIGAATAQRLASEGVAIVACSRSQTDLDSLIASLDDRRAHVALATDLESDAGVAELLSFLAMHDLNIDIIVNNLGGNLDFTDPQGSPSDFWRVMKFNLNSALELNHHLIPAMQGRRWGRVCHVSSISGIENQGPPAYGAAKAALNAYVRSLGRYVCSDNVILTGVMPGAVMTSGGYWEQATNDRPEHVEKYLAERMAIGRFGTVDEISDAVAFLVSEQASFLAGSILLADGGQGRTFFPRED